MCLPLTRPCGEINWGLLGVLSKALAGVRVDLVGVVLAWPLRTEGFTPWTTLMALLAGASTVFFTDLAGDFEADLAGDFGAGLAGDFAGDFGAGLAGDLAATRVGFVDDFLVAMGSLLC